jgi:hypothetical protein
MISYLRICIFSDDIVRRSDFTARKPSSLHHVCPATAETSLTSYTQPLVVRAFLSARGLTCSPVLTCGALRPGSLHSMVQPASSHGNPGSYRSSFTTSVVALWSWPTQSCIILMFFNHSPWTLPAFHWIFNWKFGTYPIMHNSNVFLFIIHPGPCLLLIEFSIETYFI